MTSSFPSQGSTGGSQTYFLKKSKRSNFEKNLWYGTSEISQLWNFFQNSIFWYVGSLVWDQPVFVRLAHVVPVSPSILVCLELIFVLFIENGKFLDFGQKFTDQIKSSVSGGVTDEIENRNGTETWFVRRNLHTRRFFGLNPTTWQNYQPRPTNHVQSTAQVRPESVRVVVSGPMKTDKSLQKRDERTKVTESRDLFVT